MPPAGRSNSTVDATNSTPDWPTGVAPLTVRKARLRQGVELRESYPRLIIDSAWLRDQYIVQRRELDDICRDVGVSPATIGRAIQRDGLSRQQETIEIDRDWLHEQWVIQRRTIEDIASERDVSPTTVKRIIRRHRLARRTETDVDAVWLGEQYGTKRRTIKDIGTEAGVSEAALRRAIKTYRVKRGASAAIDQDWLSIQYVVKRRGLNELGVEIGLSTATVFLAVQRYGLQRSARRHGPPALSDPVWLRGRYIADGATAGDIANELGFSLSTIRRALTRHSIRRK
jgi:AraC-like DNA-binding protein